MIEPTVGRVVHYHPPYDLARIEAAIITHVWSERCVNLACFDQNGNSYGMTSVVLLQDHDVPPGGVGYAEWMPFQKGQAMKNEELEKQLEQANNDKGFLKPGCL